jgi:hypothetical protein
VGHALAAWIPVLLIVAGAIGFLMLRKYRLQQLEVESRQHKSELSLNVKVTPRVFHQGEEWFLEATIEVSNASAKTWCVPAVYVCARALVDKQRKADYEGKTDFDDLPACPPLSTPLNRAYLPNSIIQIAPGETEQFVRWDRLDKEFVLRFPVVVISAEVFGASAELLGEQHYPTLTRGKYRRTWLEHMAGRAQRGDCSVMFARWCTLGHQASDPFAAGERFIQVAQDGKLLPEESASRDLRKVLDTVVQWSRQTTVDLTERVEVVLNR